MVSDPIGDMLARIRNALMAGKASVVVPKSKIKIEIARILHEEGYIESYTVGDEAPVPMIQLELKYHGPRRLRRPVISNMTRVSKPGRRVYRGSTDLPRVLSGTGIAIMTTPRGVMTAAQAKRERVGGEVICYVW
ncbi:MAG: 30S ribosomal protein S8 [Anaerolineae bacterium]|jgi:small subunit ribosomal protein S8|nr:30S ribosomal protein S8 [Anaerolineae bacterium]